jgi:hypothetical protein
MVTDDDTSKTPRNDSFIGNLTGYLDTRIDLVRLEVQQKVKDIFIGVVHGTTLAILGLLFVVFLSIFAGLALNHALSSSYLGFGIVAAFYLLLLVLVLVGLDKSAFKGLADKLFKDTIYKSDKRQD